MRTYVKNGNGRLKRVQNKFGGCERPQFRAEGRVQRDAIRQRDLLRQFEAEVADDRDVVVTENQERCPTTLLPVEPNGTVTHRVASRGTMAHQFVLTVKYDSEGRALRAFTG